MTVDELAQVKPSIGPFNFYCDIDGCFGTAIHLATYQTGKRIKECQLCNQHYIELSRKLAWTAAQEDAE